MASRSKNKTTFAKLAREARLRERRMQKQAKKRRASGLLTIRPHSPATLL